MADEQAAVPPRLSLWRGLGATIRLLPRVGTGLTAFALVTLVAAALSPVAFTVASGWLIGSIPATIRDGVSSPATRRTWLLLGVVAAVFLLDHVAQQALAAVSHTVQRRVDGHLRERVVRASLVPVGIRHLEDPSMRDVFSLARDLAPTGFTPGSAAAGLFAGNRQRLGSLVAAGIVATYSWPIALALLAAGTVVQVKILAFLFRNVKSLFLESADLRTSTYYRDLALTPPAAKEVRVFGLLPWISERFLGHWKVAMEVTWADRRQGRVGLVLTAVLAAAAEGGLLVYVGYAGIRGDLDLAGVAVLLGAGTLILGASASQHELAIAYGAAVVPAIIAAERASATMGAATGQEPAARLPRRQISFEGVTFAYPGSDEAVFDGLDLAIPAGQRLAIVGLNGAGKTTLVKLLCRLYEPDAGRITVDGVALDALDAIAWRRQVAALFQDFARYHLTALENVAWAAGVDGVGDGRPEAEAAAGRVGALDKITSLDLGWDTILSPQYVGGTDLSGGQWQRVALARALVKVDAGAQLLILDEPTANLDARAEAELYDRFIDITAAVNQDHPLTTILISHRFSTVRRADRIVVLEHGRVIEDGTHDELVVRAGRYAALFNAQASRFTDADAGADDDASVPAEPA